MRSLWRRVVRIIFWSYERGTLPYDVAVAVIILFVLLSPRSWFNDRPQINATISRPAVSAGVEMRGSDPQDGATIYRVDAQLVGKDPAELQNQLHDAVRRYAPKPLAGDFEIVRISAVRGPDGSVTHYDVSTKP